MMSPILMTFFIIVSVLACYVTCTTIIDADFEQFKTTFDRRYTSSEEESFRYRNFLINLATARELSKVNPLATFDINQFSDLSKEEMNQYRSGKVPNTTGYTITPVPLDDDVNHLLATSIDWRTHPGVVTDVKNQGPCGTCWSFASIGTVEGAWALSGHIVVPPVSLSEQELLDCSGSDPNSGPYGVDFIVHNGGINSHQNYPYTGHCVGACNATLKAQKVAVVSGVKCLPNGGPEEDILNMLRKGPMAISLSANTLGSYRGGILTECSDRNLDHSVTLVGYGEEGGVPYWLLKNSWGKSWGESGYFRLKYGVDCLGLAGGGPCQAY